MNSIRKGFNSLVPLRFLRPFSPSELSLLFCGQEVFSLADWRKHTQYLFPASFGPPLNANANLPNQIGLSSSSYIFGDDSPSSNSSPPSSSSSSFSSSDNFSRSHNSTNANPLLRPSSSSSSSSSSSFIPLPRRGNPNPNPSLRPPLSHSPSPSSSSPSPHLHPLRTQQIAWSWGVVEALSSLQKTQLFQFVTGSTRLPPGGFANLRGHAFTVSFTLTSKPTVPTSHTCFNKLDLPIYRCKKEMQQMLLIAIEYAYNGEMNF